jgi:Flp pilus assembly protein TadB
MEILAAEFDAKAEGHRVRANLLDDRRAAALRAGKKDLARQLADEARHARDQQDSARWDAEACRDNARALSAGRRTEKSSGSDTGGVEWFGCALILGWMPGLVVAFLTYRLVALPIVWGALLVLGLALWALESARLRDT